MADQIGIELDSDTLYLTRGRDFRWNFENTDASGASINYPAGSLYFELDTRGEHNALQQVEVTKATGGSYKLIHGADTTASIALYDPATAVEPAAYYVQTALEALPSIGAGNVLVHPASFVPVWEINLTLGTGHNEVQLITFTAVPTSGTWKISYGTSATGALAYNVTAAQVQTALEGITAIGTGNVSVSGTVTDGFRVEFIGAKANTNMSQLTVHASGIDLGLSGWFFGLFGPILQGQSKASKPKIQVTTLIEGAQRFNSTLIDTLDTTLGDFFDSLKEIDGVSTEFTVHDALHCTVRVTALNSFSEVGLLTFVPDVTSTRVTGVLNNVAALSGVFTTITVDFYWDRFYQVEFIGALAQTAQAALGKNTALLTGVNSEQDVVITVLKPGAPRHLKWPFTITGSTATLKVESEVCDTVNNRTPWQLVFQPSGETAGGDPVARGRVAVQE